MENKNNLNNKNKKNIQLIVIITIIILVLVGTIIFGGAKLKSHNKSNDDVDEYSSKQINVEDDKMTIKKEVIVEIGSEVPKISDYYNNYEKQETEEIEYYFGNEKISLEDMVITNENGTFLKEVKIYKVIINGKDETTLKVVDTTKPEVKLQELTITEGDTYDIKSFVLEYKDNSNSGDYSISYKDESNSALNKEGTYDIVINICDKYDNCVEETTKLIINNKKNNNSSNTSSNSSGSTSGNNSNNTSSNSSNNSSKNDKNNSGSTGSTGNSGSSGNSGSTGSSGNTGNTGSSGNTGSTKKLVKTVNEEVVLSKETKYGTTTTTTTTVTYNIYDDGSKEEVSRSGKTTVIDYKNFNGTVPQMKIEARSIYNSLASSRTTILNKTNEYRREVGAPNLTLDEDLSMIATIKAIEMAYSNVFAHERPDGREWISLHGEYWNYDFTRFASYGENIAFYYFAADELACEGWRESEGHYKNMINPTYTKLGVGKYTNSMGKVFFVQEFGG